MVAGRGLARVPRAPLSADGGMTGPALVRQRRTAPGKGRASPNVVLAIVCVGICLANLDLLIVNVALPDIARSFGGTSLADMSWVLNGYAVAYAALLIFFGRLAERYRRNVSFLWGIFLFTAASAACGAADGVTSLVLFRLVQAGGAALMTPTSLGLLLASFPPERRSAAVQIWTASGGFAAALGPVLGGALVAVDWRWIFMANVPIGLAAMALAWRLLPEVPGHATPRPDGWAALLVTAGIAALVLGIVKAGDWGWASWRFAGSVAAALACLLLFVRHCARSANPFVDPGLFRIPQFTGATLVLAPYSMAFGALLLSVPLWEQTAWHWSALQAGLTVTPGPLLVPVTSFLLGGRLIRRWGSGRVIALGIGLFAAGFGYFALRVGLRPDVGAIVPGMMVAGVGIGLAYPAAMAAATSVLPASSFATGSGVVSMVRQAALAVGVAVFVAIVGTAQGPAAHLAAFERAWWAMAVILALGLAPLALFPRRRAVAVPQA